MDYDLVTVFIKESLTKCLSYSLWKSNVIETAFLLLQDDSDLEFAEKLKTIKDLLRKGEDPIQGLAMIDAIQRLSVDYHFQEEIDSILARQSMLSRTLLSDNNLYEIALRFRLLRQQGYHVSAGC